MVISAMAAGKNAGKTRPTFMTTSPLARGTAPRLFRTGRAFGGAGWQCRDISSRGCRLDRLLDRTDVGVMVEDVGWVVCVFDVGQAFRTSRRMRPGRGR